MINFKELVLKAQGGDEEAVCELIRTYEPLIDKYSFLFGRRDEDLKGELLVAFIKCIKNFQLKINDLAAAGSEEPEISKLGNYPQTAKEF